MTARELFTLAYRIERIIPIGVLVQAAGMSLVRQRICYNDLREDFIDAGRTVPGLYLDGIHLAQMGGEPYAIWN